MNPFAKCLSAGLAAGLLAASLAGQACAADDAKWPIAGRQGIMQFVIVPTPDARDREAYAKQVERLCEPNLTCFINFYTNSSGAPLAVPLPEAIDKEPAAIFRRSTKQGAELFRWSCRMATGDADCF